MPAQHRLAYLETPTVRIETTLPSMDLLERGKQFGCDYLTCK